MSVIIWSEEPLSTHSPVLWSFMLHFNLFQKNRAVGFLQFLISLFGGGRCILLWASFSWLCVQQWASQMISFLINKPTFACYLCWLPKASTYQWQVWACCHEGLCGLKTIRHHFLFYMISQVFSQIIFVDWKIKYFTKWDLFLKSGFER